MRTYKTSDFCTAETLAIFDKMIELNASYGNQPIKYVFNRISAFCDCCEKDYFELTEHDIKKYAQKLQQQNISYTTARLYFSGFNFVNQYVKEHAAVLDPAIFKKADFGNAINLDQFRQNFKNPNDIEPDADLCGMKFGKLKVIQRLADYETDSNGRLNEWECECECGAHIVTSRGYLVNGYISSCGNKAKHPGKRFEDLTGQCFGDYKVVSLVPMDTTSRVTWECECMTCGRKRLYEARTLKGKYAKTCPMMHEKQK